VSRLWEVYEKRAAKAREGLPHDARPEVETLPLSGRALGRVVSYSFLILVTFVVSVALGACLAVAMEYLVSWPDTWWL
jgi:hypothetical protein